MGQKITCGDFELLLFFYSLLINCLCWLLSNIVFYEYKPKVVFSTINLLQPNNLRPKMVNL